MVHWICGLIGHNFRSQILNLNREGYDKDKRECMIICPRCGDTREVKK